MIINTPATSKMKRTTKEDEKVYRGRYACCLGSRLHKSADIVGKLANEHRRMAVASWGARYVESGQVEGLGSSGGQSCQKCRGIGGGRQTVSHGIVLREKGSAGERRRESLGWNSRETGAG
jgi:hypothetical protein